MGNAFKIVLTASLRKVEIVKLEIKFGIRFSSLEEFPKVLLALSSIKSFSLFSAIQFVVLQSFLKILKHLNLSFSLNGSFCIVLLSTYKSSYTRRSGVVCIDVDDKKFDSEVFCFQSCFCQMKNMDGENIIANV